MKHGEGGIWMKKKNQVMGPSMLQYRYGKKTKKN